MGKMDSAAVGDFNAVGMENWGLNIYRGSVLYYSKEQNTEAERYGRVNVIAHELAHQWFGNLVTCKWWTDFWLNEGLTTYAESFGTRSLVPEFETEKTSLTGDIQDAMKFDIRENSHPIQLSNSVRTKGSDFVYTLLYKKSSAIIRMMEGFLGEKTLHKGLKKFIKKFSYQSVDQKDLFSLLNEQAHVDQVLIPGVTLQKIMNSWISHRGYPLVRVKASGKDGVYISQERFYRKNSSAALEKSRWYIPVAISTQANPNLVDSLPTFWIGTETIMTHWQHNISEWIVLNSGSTGYYRVIYDENLTKLIQAQLLANHALIHFGFRSQLIDDYFTFAFEGYNNITQALDFTQYLGQELELSVWIPVITHLRRLGNLLPEEDLVLFQEYLTPILDQLCDAISFEQNPHESGNIVLFRVKLMDFAFRELGHPGCKNYSVTLWNDWKDEPLENRISLDQRDVIYCTALRDHPTFDNIGFVLNRQNFISTESDKIRLLKAFLACLDYNNPKLWLSMLETSFNSSTLPPDPEQKTLATYMVLQIAKNPQGRGVVMSYLEDNLEFIISFTGDAEVVSGVITIMQDYCNTEGDLERIKMFIEKNSEKLSPVINSIKGSLAYMERNVKWIASNVDKIHEWFMAHQSSSENLG